MKIATILAEGFEETEFIAVADLLRRAKADVCVVSSTQQLTVASSHNFKITADELLDNVNFDEMDCIFLPGGMPGVTNLRANKKVIDAVQHFAEKGKYISAICAAPLVLADAGVLENKKFTCYPSTAKEITLGVYCDEPTVIDGKLMTGRGVGAALDLGLLMVSVFYGIENAEKLKKAIVYGV
ncbi:MAG: DJ-1/PfpI family protein [Spirochaetales bacterium]|nr:DJ-1/PfpI family protein [Spirochaetales bacterium]